MKNNIKPSQRKLIESSRKIVGHFKTASGKTLIYMYRYLELLMSELKAEMKKRQNKEGK